MAQCNKLGNIKKTTTLVFIKNNDHYSIIYYNIKYNKIKVSNQIIKKN